MKRINALLSLVITLTACSSQPKEMVEREDVKIEYKPITLNVPRSPAHCSVGTQMSYVQRNNIVAVDFVIAANEDQTCQVSHGEFTMKVEFDRKGEERQSLEFEEVWSRAQNEILSFELEYEIGFDTTLRSVKKIRSRCWCDNAADF
ncbi:hypothetical protein NBRC116493_21940 [Aurantivibrio infirmus]